MTETAIALRRHCAAVEGLGPQLVLPGRSSQDPSRSGHSHELLPKPTRAPLQCGLHEGRAWNSERGIVLETRTKMPYGVLATVLAKGNTTRLLTARSSAGGEHAACHEPPET